MEREVISGLIFGCVLSIFWPYIKEVLQQIEKTGSTENLMVFDMRYIAAALSLLGELGVMMLIDHEFLNSLMDIDFTTAIMLAYGGTIFGKDAFKVFKVGTNLINKRLNS